MKMLIFIIIILASGCLGGFLAWSEREKVRWSTEEMERLSKELKKHIDAYKDNHIVKESVYPWKEWQDLICLDMDKEEYLLDYDMQAAVLRELAESLSEAVIKYAQFETIKRPNTTCVRARIRIADMSNGSLKKIFEREEENEDGK